MGAWLSLKKEKKGEKRKRRKRFVSPLVEKMMMKREVAMPPTRKDDAKKGVNSTYTTHMHSLGLGL